MISFFVNDDVVRVELPEDTPLLWLLRDHLGLTGTKYGCGMALCGACTVHLEGKPVRACVTPISAAKGKTVTTIEGLSKSGEHPVQKAWLEEDVPQCGYCQSGMIMSAAALLAEKAKPTAAEIDAALAGNLCRCGTYNRVRRAVLKAATLGAAAPAKAGPARKGAPRSAPAKPAPKKGA